MNVVRKINHIFVIQSLQKGDKPTGRELYDDVIRRRIDLLQSESIKMTHSFFDVGDKTNFIEILKYIEANAGSLSGGILIHFEIHGSTDRDGLVLSDSSLVSWKELVTLLRPINIKTCNKLFITMATCYGRFLYLGVDPDKKSPYQAYISASKAIMTVEVIEKFNILFEILMDCGDLILAYKEHEKSNSPFFYKDSFRTFEDTMALHREQIDSDPEYKQRILDHPYIQKQLASGQVDDATMDSMIDLVFKQIVIRHAKAFNFSDCD